MAKSDFTFIFPLISDDPVRTCKSGLNKQLISYESSNLHKDRTTVRKNFACIAEIGPYKRRTFRQKNTSIAFIKFRSYRF